MLDIWVEHIAAKLGAPILTTGDEVRFNCFKNECGISRTPDTKYHLYVNPVKGTYFCQRCQAGGSLEWLTERLGLESPERSLLLWEKLIHAFIYGVELDDERQKRARLPKDFNSIIRGTEAYRYLYERGIKDEKIEAYGIGFGTQKMNEVPKEHQEFFAGAKRIVIPDYDASGELCYWVARTYGKHAAKYKNAKVPRDDKVFNLGRILRSKERRRIVICEGPISAIVAGYDAVSTYGKYVTGNQISLLAQAEAEEYVIAGDGDALMEAVSLATRLFRRGLNVKFARFYGTEDPASVGAGEARRRIREAFKWHPLSALEVLA